jgi:hypothetical protein
MAGGDEIVLGVGASMSARLEVIGDRRLGPSAVEAAWDSVGILGFVEDALPALAGGVGRAAFPREALCLTTLGVLSLAGGAAVPFGYWLAAGLGGGAYAGSHSAELAQSGQPMNSWASLIAPRLVHRVPQ